MQTREGSPGSLWVPPMHATMKINVYGTYNLAIGEAVVGIIARDHGGNPQVMAWDLLSNCKDAEEAEALACLEGAQPLHQWLNHVQVVLESDCATMVMKVSSNVSDCSIIYHT
jgi:hypothetical protein